MRVSKCLGLLAAVLLIGGTALAEVPTVYVTYPNADGVYSWSTTAGSIPTPTGQVGAYEDLVVDPSNSVYACDPSTGFQCGWYTQYGDRIVTEKFGSRIFVFPADQTNHQGSHLLVDVGSGELEGVTQAANGDLLVVDRAGGRVVRVPFNINLDYPYGFGVGWFDTSSVDPSFISGLDLPVGIARSSRGDIYVTTDDGVFTFGSVEVPDTNDPDYPQCLKPNKPSYPCDTVLEFGSSECPVLDLHRQGRPYFLEFDAHDTLYIAATDRASSKLYSYDPYADGANCTPNLISEIDDDVIALPLVGMAVPYGNVVEGKRATSLGGDPITPDVQIQNFYDHAYEFRFEPYNGPPGGGDPDGYCAVDISALEVEPDFLRQLLESIPNPDDPGFNYTGDPVIYSGENGRGIAYQVVPFMGDPDCTAADVFRHSINAFTGYIPNPRIVRCSDLIVDQCELIDLNTYFPFNGIFPDDGRISSKSNTFSWYFLADVDLENGTGNGDFCGFDSPWYEPMLPGWVEWTDSDVLEYFTAADFPAYSTTETVALKFQIADLDAPDGSCDSGPYIEAAVVLMSIARVRDENYGVLDPFEPVPIYAAGSSAVVDPALFNSAANPTKQYHFNAKFTGYEPGIYQLVLVPLTNNFAAEVRYFRVQ